MADVSKEDLEKEIASKLQIKIITIFTFLRMAFDFLRRIIQKITKAYRGRAHVMATYECSEELCLSVSLIANISDSMGSIGKSFK